MIILDSLQHVKFINDVWGRRSEEIGVVAYNAPNVLWTNFKLFATSQPHYCLYICLTICAEKRWFWKAKFIEGSKFTKYKQNYPGGSVWLGWLSAKRRISNSETEETKATNQECKWKPCTSNNLHKHGNFRADSISTIAAAIWGWLDVGVSSPYEANKPRSWNLIRLTILRMTLQIRWYNSSFTLVSCPGIYTGIVNVVQVPTVTCSFLSVFLLASGGARKANRRIARACRVVYILSLSPSHFQLKIWR